MLAWGVNILSNLYLLSLASWRETCLYHIALILSKYQFIETYPSIYLNLFSLKNFAWVLLSVSLGTIGLRSSFWVFVLETPKNLRLLNQLSFLNLFLLLNNNVIRLFQILSNRMSQFFFTYYMFAHNALINYAAHVFHSSF